jgi:hypothetical protein
MSLRFQVKLATERIVQLTLKSATRSRGFAMRKALLLALLLSPGSALASSPDRISGKMVDVVAEGLRRYRQETDPIARAMCLRQLAPLLDPRVEVALAEALRDPYPAVRYTAVIKLRILYMPPDGSVRCDEVAAVEWWKKNGTQIRKRAGMPVTEDTWDYAYLTWPEQQP